MSGLILPEGVQTPDLPTDEQPGWERCSLIGVALDVADKIIEDRQIAGENVHELCETRDNLVRECARECGRINGCAAEAMAQLDDAGLVTPDSPRVRIYHEVTGIIIANAIDNDGLYGLLSRKDRYLKAELTAELDPLNAKMTKQGHEPVTLTDGAVQRLGIQSKHDMVVAKRAAVQLAQIMADIQTGWLLTGWRAKIAKTLVRPPVIHNEDIEVLFQEKAFIELLQEHEVVIPNSDYL